MGRKFNISISMDGPPEIQNRNRPLVQHLEISSAVVESTVRLLVAHSYPFTIRVTYAVRDDIIKVIEYFASLGVKKIHLEPLFPFGRSYEDDKPHRENQMVLLDKFVEAIDACERLGIKVFNSHLHQFTRGLRYFCGAASGGSLVVTHDGLLTGCLEVVDGNDKDMPTFRLGKWLPEKRRFEVDVEKVISFRNRYADNLARCRECFARYTCAGGCAVKAVRAGGNFFSRDGSYCEFTRGFVPILVKRIAAMSGV